MLTFLKKNIFLILLFLCILPYNYYSFLFNKHTVILNAFIYLVRVILIVYLLIFLKYKKINNYELQELKQVTLYFYLILLLNIISNLLYADFNLYNLISRIFSMIYVYCFYIFMIYNYKNIMNITKALKIVGIILLLFSLFFYIFFPNIGRMYEGNNSFAMLGVATNRNSLFELMIPTVVSIFFLKSTNKMSFFDKVFIIIIFIVIILSKSVTSIISLCVFILLIFFNSLKIDKIKILKKSLLLVCVIWILYFIIVFLNSDLSFISSFFNNKSTTFSGRTIIWQKALLYIRMKPFIGYGYDNTIIKNINGLFYQSGLIFPNDTHNSLLFILLSSGILGLIMLLIFIYKRVKNGIKIIEYDKRYYYIMAYIISNLIRGLTESCFHYSHIMFFLYLIFMDVRKKELEEINYEKNK